MKLFGTIVQGLEKNMDLRLLRQQIIGANIANVDTPGYKAKDIDFNAQLSEFVNENDEAMSATSPGHFGSRLEASQVEGEVIEQEGDAGPDQNTVDLDRQMAEMSSNAFNYSASAKMMRKRLGLLRYVISETR